MAIPVPMLCERTNDHGGRRPPTAALWTHSRRHTALRNHTKKQVNVVKSRKKHRYLYYYDHYGHSASCLPSRYLAKDVKIGPHNDDLYYCAQLAHNSILVSRRCLPFWRSRDELFNKQQ